MTGVDSEHDKDRIRQVIENLGNTFRRKDINGFVKHFSKDVIALYPTIPIIHGVARWREFIEAAVKDNVSVEYEEIIVKAESSEFGHAVGIFRGVNKSSNGLDEFRSRFLASLARIDGEWKITAICYNR